MSMGFDPEAEEPPPSEQELPLDADPPPRRPVDLDMGRAGLSSERSWSSFVARAATILAASLDDRATLDNLLHVTVPRLAEWAVAYLLLEEDEPPRMGWRHADPAQAQRLQELVTRCDIEPGRPFLGRAIGDSPGPVLVRNLGDAFLLAELPNEETRALFRALRPTSMIGASLVAHGRVVGAVSLFTSGPRPRYDSADVVRVSELVGLEALAADNARLHRVARRELAERQRMETQLSESLSLHQSTLESTADGLLVVDAHRKIVSYNRRFAEMWGIPESVLSAEGLDRAQAIAREQVRDPEAFVARIEELYDRPAEESFDIVELRDGRIFERYSRPQRIANRIVGRVWSYRDATAATRAARLQQLLGGASAALASSLEYGDTLRRVAELAVPLLGDWCEIFLLESDGRLHDVALAGPAEGVGSRGDVAPARGPPEPSPWSPSVSIALDAQHPAATAFRAGEPLQIGDLDDQTRADLGDPARPFHRQPELLPHTVLAVPMEIHGRRLGVMMFVRARQTLHHQQGEIEVATELAHLAAVAVDNAHLFEAALAANQAKVDFLAVMSHELRTPLTAVMGYTELIADGFSGPVSDQQRYQLGRIQASASHLLQLIEQILSFARVEAGREEVRPELCNPRLIIEEIAMLVHPAATKKGLRLIVELPESMPLMRTDPGKMRQILINLLSNAVKFTDRGEVGVAAHREADTLVIRVWDTGVGIAAEHLERIFDPFWQVEQPLSRRSAGTGLGLSVARRLARLLGGEVRVRSRLGEGTGFTVRVPNLSVEQ
jgi:PAS domain S-box-containing protein